MTDPENHNRLKEGVEKLSESTAAWSMDFGLKNLHFSSWFDWKRQVSKDFSYRWIEDILPKNNHQGADINQIWRTVCNQFSVEGDT